MIAASARSHLYATPQNGHALIRLRFTILISYIVKFRLHRLHFLPPMMGRGLYILSFARFHQHSYHRVCLVECALGGAQSGGRVQGAAMFAVDF